MNTPSPARRRRLALAASALAAALLLSACAGGTAPDAGGETSDPVSGGTLTFGRAAAANDLDLNQQITANNAFAIDKIFEPLVSFDADGKIIPWLAEYTVDDAGTSYVFTLREGLQFSDGTDVTPADVVFSLKRHQEVEGPLPLTAPISDIAETGEREVTITLTEAYTPFISELASFSNGIFPADFGGLNEQEFFQQPIGTGPFVVTEWDPNGDMTFVKNEHYWQEGKPYLDGLVYRVIADDAQLRQQLAAGQIDAIDTVPAANAAEVSAAASTELSQTPGWSTEQVFFNTQREQFGDEHVRRAIAHAIDREGITAATTFDTAEVANALLPPTITDSANDTVTPLEFDLDAAKAELAKSAFPDGFETTLLIASGNAQRAQIAQIVQESLGKIGIDVTIEQLDIAVFRERFFAYDFDFMLNSGQSDAPDPNGFITFQADPAGFSKSYWTHYEDDRVTELMHEGRTTPEGEERTKIYAEIQQILADQVPYVPLFFPSNLKATTSDVHGFTVLPNGSVLFQDTWLGSGGTA
ncbi:peptide/nickel transport system substrate-binding protein [Leucobacter luti]|uniref:Peptide/nickel transport system substrate-binding protein n=1 Tax=Leucobacter luti TaxID=340320 RepID=A0A4R6RV67_9MICO|nr:ABC transporter substrate-binding protein [Leucobacter luti]TDP90861.1 peptide/nickel transport system substrate-binding protein [Leucobacter luti]